MGAHFALHRERLVVWRDDLNTEGLSLHPLWDTSEEEETIWIGEGPQTWLILTENTDSPPLSGGSTRERELAKEVPSRAERDGLLLITTHFKLKGPARTPRRPRSRSRSRPPR